MSIELTQALAFFNEAEEMSLESRTLCERCRDYYDHKQWTARETATLRSRKQPVITRNRIKPKVDYLRGIELQTRTDPEAAPRTQIDEESAQAATDAVRYVYDKSLFAKVKSEVFENLVIEGAGGVEVYCKPGSGEDIEICIKRYHWDRLGWDPHSRELDFSDTLYRYAVAWMDYDLAIERYPKAADVLSSTMSGEALLSTTYDDAPRLKWADANRKRVRIVKLEYLQGGDVWTCEFTRAGFLSEPSPSPYLNTDGNPEWSIIMQSSHVDREGNRYGHVKAWLDIQDEINKRASKHLHLVSVRQTYSTEGASEDVQKLKAELAKPDGHLKFQRGEYGKDFGVLPTMDQANAQFQLMQEAKQEIDSIGVNAAMAGIDQRELSGNAIRKLQQGASTELRPLFECIARFDTNVCRAVWNRIKQFWTAEKWIRVTNDNESPRWIGLNVPVVERGEVVGLQNSIAEIDVDFTIVESPDVVNSMQEQFEALTTIYPSIPDDKKSAAFEMLVEASSLRNKKKVLERLKGNINQQSVDMQQKMAELQVALLQAKIDLANAQADKAKSAATVDNVETLYSAMQTAQVAATVPGVVSIADEVAKSAGFVDRNQAPIYPQPAPPAVTGIGNQPVVHKNTSPMFPAKPVGPGEGIMTGIETPENDGAVAGLRA
jgi:hypothetical protein